MPVLKYILLIYLKNLSTMKVHNAYSWLQGSWGGGPVSARVISHHLNYACYDD